jgi:Protein of unknown function (DUF5661)
VRNVSDDPRIPAKSWLVILTLHLVLERSRLKGWVYKNLEDVKQYLEGHTENRQRRIYMDDKKRTTPEEAKHIGDQIGVDWTQFDLEQFRQGMDVEYEHGKRDPQTDVTHDDPILTGKIALAHMKEFPDYYERLETMEKEAARKWAGRRVNGES